MKIIDEKGRLFGIINFIDFIIITFVIFSSIAIYIAIAFPGRISRIQKGERKSKEVLVTVVLEKDTEFIYDQILPGEVQKDRYSEPIAVILGKKWFDIENSRYAVINLKVKARVESGGVLTFRELTLTPGEEFKFKSERIKLRGYVLKVEDFK